MKTRSQKESSQGPRFESWLVEPLPADVRRALDRVRRLDDVRHVAVMPDVHLAQGVCIGTVVATATRILPQAIGSDIGCGMAALCFDTEAPEQLDAELGAQIVTAMRSEIPIIRHSSRNAVRTLPHDLIDHAGMPTLSAKSLVSAARREGRLQLGTLGRGNHFVELQRDEDRRLWVMLHSGSRCMGQEIFTYHLQHAEPGRSGLHYFEANTDAGRAFLSDVAWARQYAAANRQQMLAVVVGIVKRFFGAAPVSDSLIALDHNHVRRETHGNEELWVHRKGAVSARADELGIIPGSMGTMSFHTRGRGCSAALCSSAHGAGRRLSRDAARRSFRIESLMDQMEGVYFDERIAGVLTDESPFAYKDVNAVMRAQRPLTKIVRRLHPLLVYKGV